MKNRAFCGVGLRGRLGLAMVVALATFPAGVSGQEEPMGASAVPTDVKTETKVSAKPTPTPSDAPDVMKVTFDETIAGVIYVESNGEKIRVDTNKKTVEKIAVSTLPANDSTAEMKSDDKSDQTAAKPSESAYDFETGEEPYGYRLINVPTPKSVPKGTWNMEFTHRFSQPLHPLSSSGTTLLGLDSFGIASFGMTYGVTDKLYVSAYRSPLCQKGLCRVIELGVGYNFLSNSDSPFALSAYASIEGNENFTEEYTYNLQSRMSARLGKRVYVFFSPAVHINANGQRRFNPRPGDFFPPAPIANTFELPTHAASFGFGTSILIRPDILALFEFTPRVGFKLGRVSPVFNSNFNVIGFVNKSYPELALGIQKNIGKHSFALTFSNTQTTTTSRYNSSNLVLKPRRLIIGFNLSRRF